MEKNQTYFIHSKNFDTPRALCENWSCEKNAVSNLLT